MDEDLRARIDAHPGWYHTIELPDASVTPGMTDLRDVAAKALPESLAGKRCLDIGTFDGFWAFSMEERGAAEVLTLDVEDVEQTDLPPNTRDRIVAERDRSVPWGAGFHLAREARGSSVQRVVSNVYDLGLETIGGRPVDLVLCGTILQHLRDPVGALERMRSVLAPAGELLMMETYSASLSGWRHGRRALAEFRPAIQWSLYTWWAPNRLALEHWARTAGFEPIGDALVDRTAGPGAGPEDRILARRFRQA